MQGLRSDAGPRAARAKLAARSERADLALADAGPASTRSRGSRARVPGGLQGRDLTVGGHWNWAYQAYQERCRPDGDPGSAGPPGRDTLVPVDNERPIVRLGRAGRQRACGGRRGAL